MNKYKTIITYNNTTNFLVEIEEFSNLIIFVGYVLEYKLLNKDDNLYLAKIIYNQNQILYSKDNLFKKLMSLQYSDDDEKYISSNLDILNSDIIKKYTDYKIKIEEFINNYNLN